MRRIIDLSLPIDKSMRGVDIQAANRLAVDGWNATTLSLYSHAGTHMDSPFHFISNGATIDAQAFESCIGPARVVNLAPASPRQLIQPDDLNIVADWVHPGCRILLRTDWHLRYGTEDYRSALPRISVDCARWIVEKGVALLGVEPPSVADVGNMQELTEVHQTLLGGNVVIVEGLANLDRLTQDVVEFVGLPLRIRGGDGSPIRAIAMEDA